MSKQIQVRLLVGLGDEDTTPLVAGAIDSGLWEVQSPEDTDAQFSKMKRPFEGSGYGYEWREVTVSLDVEALLAHFSGPVLQGVVSASATDELGSSPDLGSRPCPSCGCGSPAHTADCEQADAA